MPSQSQSDADADETMALPSFRPLYLLTGVVALLVAGDLICWWLGYERLRNPWGVNLALVAALAGGARIVYASLTALWEGHVGADLALAVAMLASVALKEYWVGAEVVLIAMIGESLEAITFARTHREIERILTLRPLRVRVRRGEDQIEVPAEQVQVGDIVIVRPGERIAVDGAVVAGRSAVDQSTLTGESMAIDKAEGDTVYAGTLNQFGALEIRADAVGDATTLGQVIRLVASAQGNKAQVERIADQLARWFLPLVLACAAATFLYTNRQSLAQATWPALDGWVWMPTLAVLVVTCPCALVLATPAAVMAAVAWLARRGVLIKGGAALERLATVRRIAFDKTGTLTTGQLEVADCLPLGGHTENEVLQTAAAAEQSSEHLIARVLVAAAKSGGLALPALADFEALPGAGIAARLLDSGGQVVVGNRRLMGERDIDVADEVETAISRLEQAGQTPILVAMDGRIAGAIGIRDRLRPEALRVVGELREIGIEEIVVLSGDRASAVAEVVRQLGIHRWQAELRPDEKAQWLAGWRAERRGGSRASEAAVAMVGDGINDAPALARADVGLALAGAGCDLAAEAGDLLLMGDPLAPLPGTIQLARETVRVIRQNILLFAFFVNFLGVVLTAWIMPSWSEAWLRRAPVAAAVFHQCGSVLVLLNAMRLLWFERWQKSWAGRVEAGLAHACGRVGSTLAPVARLGETLWWWRWPLVRVAATLLVVAYLSQIVVFVNPDEVAVVRRFGRFHAALGPGPHLRLPPPWDMIVKDRPARVRTVEIGLSSTRSPDAGNNPAIEWNTPHDATGGKRNEEAVALTGDQSLVEIAAAVQYRIDDLRAWHFTARDPQRLLQATTQSVVRQVLAGRPLLSDDTQGRSAAAEILTIGRGELEREIRDRLQAEVDSLGMGVRVLDDGVCLIDVHPPLAVVDAFRDVSSAFKERERRKNEADAYLRDRVIKAGGVAAWRELGGGDSELTDERWLRLQPELAGEAAAALAAASAFASEQEELATGEAAEFLLLQSSHSTKPELTEWRMLFDTLSAALTGRRKIILDSHRGARRHLFLGRSPNEASPSLPAILSPPPDEED
ncbi:MAG TPA: cation-translocating P-type ATPase family protein [Pirellulales bacterium]|nr:cation-translocating P-type ATPase family protein [Pirellulales bacterium]